MRAGICNDNRMYEEPFNRSALGMKSIRSCEVGLNQHNQSYLIQSRSSRNIQQGQSANKLINYSEDAGCQGPQAVEEFATDKGNGPSGGREDSQWPKRKATALRRNEAVLWINYHRV